MIDQLKKQMVRRGLTVKSVVSIFIFAAICLVFVLFGLTPKTAGMGGESVGAAARVNDSLISIADLRSETQRLEQIYAPMMGGMGGALGGDAQRQFIRGQAVENLISMEILAQAAQKEGVIATDAEVRDFIVKDIPVFQKEGRFQRDLYQNYLSYSKTAAGEFEEKIRKDRKQQRARRLFEAVSVPLTLEVQKLKALRGKQHNVAFVKIDKDQWLNKTPVTEADIKVKLADADFQKRIETYFNSNKTEFAKEAQVHAQHILIKAQEGDEAAMKAALEKIQGLKKRSANEDFGKLAREFSDDTGSKEKSGDLGTFGKGRMVPEFEKAAFEQSVGVVGEPVKTAYGYHIIKVLEKMNPEAPEISKVQAIIAKKLILTDRFEAGLKTLEEALGTADPSSAVDTVIKSWGLAWDETGFFDLAQDSIPKLGSPLVSNAAFEVTEAKPFLNHLVRDGAQKYVMKLKASKNEAGKADDKTLLSELTRENSYQLFSQWLESTKKSAKIEKNIQAIQGR